MVTEWLGSGLQNHLGRFDSAPSLQKNISHGLIFEQHARGTVGRVIHLPWGYGRQGYVGGVILRCVAQKCLDTLSKFGIVLPE